MPKSRRSILGTCGTALTAGIAGCSDSSDSGDSGAQNAGVDEESEPDSDGDGVPDAEDAYPNDPERSVKDTKSGSIDVQEDEWYQWGYDTDKEFHLEYEFLVRDGPAVDVFLTTESEYSHYADQERAKYISSLSDFDTSQGVARGWVEAGEYRLVVDNTDWGEAAPPTNFDDDVAEVEYTITVSR